MDFPSFTFFPSLSLFLSVQFPLQILGRVEALCKLLPCSLRYNTSPSNLETAGWIWRHLIGSRNTLLGSVQLPTLTAVIVPCDLDKEEQDNAATENDQKWE